MHVVTEKTSTCPSCGALVDGQDAICCAERQIVYHCVSCDTHRLAFATPLGRCEQCGGELQQLARPEAVETDTIDAETLSAIRQACEIEIGGTAFYARAAEAVTDPEAKALLVRLRDMEQQHMTSLEERFHVDLSGGTDNALSISSFVVYGDTTPPNDALGVLKLAAELERRARDFFADRVGSLPTGSLARTLYAEFLQDEEEHLRLLNELIATR